MIKERTRAQSYLLTNCHNKRHCPEDLTCTGCCPCAKELRKRTTILLDKITSIKQEKQELERLLRKFARQIEQYQKKVKSMKGAEDAKEELREEIRKQLEEQRKFDDLIAQEKMKSLKERNQQLEKENELLSSQLRKLKDQCEILNAAEKKAVQKLKEIERKFEKDSSLIQEQAQKLKHQQMALVSMKQALAEKTALITSLSAAIAKGEEHYILEKSKAANLQFQSFKSQQEIKQSNNLIELLKQKDQEKTLGMETLIIEKNQLRRLVNELDSTIYSYGKLQTQLKDRLWVSQQYAIQKQIEAKQVEMDYYDLRRHV